MRAAQRGEFTNQKALQEYVERHDLEYVWEGMNGFRKRLATLAPEQYELVDVQTKRGVTRALVFSRAILRAEMDANRPFREALEIKRKRLRAKRVAREMAKAAAKAHSA